MKLNELKKHNHSPYSKTLEICVVVGKSGMAYPGVRLENISYPLSISSVQGAICSCLGNEDQPVSVLINGEKPELYQQWISEFNLNELTELPDNITWYKPLISKVDDISGYLEKLAEKAVTTHSSFPVSALLKVDDGFIPGVNVEVEAWSLGLCAERVAIFRAVSAGYKNFDRISIFAPKGDFSSPCGACRQVLAEWMNDKKVELYHGDGSKSQHFVSQLLPYGFTSGALGDR